jgi:hypothetical protein
MRQARAQEEDSRLETKRRLKYKDTARIRLELLHFLEDEPKKIDPKHVETLKRYFRKYDYRRLKVRNHVPAVIDQQCLDAATRASGISTTQLLGDNPQNRYPELILPGGHRLECLHGRHRIQAGREFLSPSEKWWTVDLYLAGTIMRL